MRLLKAAATLICIFCHPCIYSESNANPIIRKIDDYYFEPACGVHNEMFYIEHKFIFLQDGLKRAIQYILSNFGKPLAINQEDNKAIIRYISGPVVMGGNIFFTNVIIKLEKTTIVANKAIGVKADCTSSLIEPLQGAGSSVLRYYGPVEPTIPYFSAAGLTVARINKLPIAPFQKGTANTVDPPRTVAAAKWNGAFCRAWTDECTSCERDDKEGKALCRPDAKARVLGDLTSPKRCTPHVVKCKQNVREDKLAGVCKVMSYNEIERLPGQPERVTFSATSTSSWFFSRNERRWLLSIVYGGDIQGDVPRFDPYANPVQKEYFGEDYRCVRAVGEGISKYDAGPLIER